MKEKPISSTENLQSSTSDVTREDIPTIPLSDNQLNIEEDVKKPKGRRDKVRRLSLSQG